MSASSHRVGNRSTRETLWRTVCPPPARRRGAVMLNGTRAEASKNCCFSHSPFCPSISPWSLRKTITKSSSTSSSSSLLITRPYWRSTNSIMP